MKCFHEWFDEREKLEEGWGKNFVAGLGITGAAFSIQLYYIKPIDF